MAGIELATAYVSLLPSLAGLRRALSTLDETIRVNVDQRGIQSQVSRSLREADARLEVEAATAPMRAQIDRATRDANATIRVNADTAAARMQMLRLQDAFDKAHADAERSLAHIDGHVEVDADTASVRAQIERAVSGITGNIKVEIHKGALEKVKTVLSGLASVGGLAATTGALTTKLGLLVGAAGTAVNVLAGLGSTAVTAAGALPVVAGGAAAAGTALAAAKVGLLGFDKTLSALATGDVKKFNESLAQLSPNARSTALAIKSMAPAFTAMKNSVQDRLFAGMASQVHTLGATYLPILRTGLGGAASQLNAMARSMTSYLTSARAQSSVTTIMGNTTATLARMRGVLRDVVAGLLQVASTGSGFLPQFGSMIAGVAARFRAWVAQAQASGRLQQMIAAGMRAIVQVGQVVGNVVGTVVNVFHALNGIGGGLLGRLVQLTGAMKNWTASAQGQGALRTVFVALQQAAAVLAPVLGQVARTVGQMAVQIAPLLPQIAALAGQFISALLPVLRQVVPILLQAAMSVMPPLIQAFRVLTPVIVQVAGFVAQLARALAPLLPPLAQLAGVILTALMAALRPLIPPFVQLAQAILPPLVAVVRALSPMLALAGRLLASMARAVTPLVSWLGRLIASVARSHVVMGLFKAAFTVARVAVRIFSTWIKTVIGVISGLGKAAKFVGGLVGKAFRGIGSVGTWLYRNAIRPAFHGIGVIIGGIVGVGRRVVAGLKSAWSWFGSLGSRARTWFGGFTSGIRSAIGRAIAFVRSVPGKIRNGLGNLGNLLAGAGRAIIGGLVGGMRRIWEKGKHFVSGIASWIKRHKGPVSADARLLQPAGLAIMNGLTAGLSSGFGDVQALVAQVAGQIQSGLSVTPTVGPPQVAGTQLAAAAAASATGSPGSSAGVAPIVIRFDASNTDPALLAWLRKAVRTQGGGNVQQALGTGK